MTSTITAQATCSYCSGSDTSRGCDVACAFCGTLEDRMMNAAHWTGDRETGGWERIHVCTDEACRGQIATRPRAPRRPRQPIPATDYNMLGAFLGTGNGVKKSRKAAR